MNRRSWLIPGALAAFLMASLPASAGVTPGSNDFEMYAGIAFPGDGTFDDDATYGIRFGRALGPHAGIQVELGHYEDRQTVDVLATPTRFDLDILHVDVSAVYHVNPESRAVFTVLGGIGWASQDLDIDKVNAVDADSLTAHLGFGTKIYLGQAERVFIRLEARGRWFEDRETDEVDFETTASLGWTWGGQ